MANLLATLVPFPHPQLELTRFPFASLKAVSFLQVCVGGQLTPAA